MFPYLSCHKARSTLSHLLLHGVIYVTSHQIRCFTCCCCCFCNLQAAFLHQPTQTLFHAKRAPLQSSNFLAILLCSCLARCLSCLTLPCLGSPPAATCCCPEVVHVIYTCKIMHLKFCWPERSRLILIGSQRVSKKESEAFYSLPVLSLLLFLLELYMLVSA